MSGGAQHVASGNLAEGAEGTIYLRASTSDTRDTHGRRVAQLLSITQLLLEPLIKACGDPGADDRSTTGGEEADAFWVSERRRVLPPAQTVFAGAQMLEPEKPLGIEQDDGTVAACSEWFSPPGRNHERWPRVNSFTRMITVAQEHSDATELLFELFNRAFGTHSSLGQFVSSTGGALPFGRRRAAPPTRRSSRGPKPKWATAAPATCKI